MSGGLAFVYDDTADFARNCNPEMVDIDPAFKDAELLHGFLQEHLDCTGSKVASFILNDLDNQLQHFRKVFPRDYKKMLTNKLVAMEGGKGIIVT